MRLTVTLAAAALLSPIVPAALAADPAFVDPVSTPDRQQCAGNRQASTPNDKPRRSSSKLGDMPPATHIKAVHRLMNGCPAPIVVARGVGNPQPGAKADDPAMPGRIMPAATPHGG